MRLILLGAPGAGKGTQASFISERFNIPVISTGEILRDAIREGTSVGLKAKAIIEKGSLAPDDLIISVVGERLGEDDCKNGFILDGMPRTIPQAEALEEGGVRIDVALHIEAEDAVIEERMTGRRFCPDCGTTYHITDNPPKREGLCDTCGARLTQRGDDRPETVRERLKVYHHQTEPLLEFYRARGKLASVRTQVKVEDTKKLVMEALETFA